MTAKVGARMPGWAFPNGFLGGPTLKKTDALT
jgi:hypothetical protein